MVGDRALVLILTLCPLLQSGPRGPLETRAYTLEGCALEDLVREIEEQLLAQDLAVPPTDDRAKAYVTATTYLLGFPEQELCRDKDLTFRVERAREAAPRYGTNYDRFLLENEYAQTLLFDYHRAGEARRVLQAARERFTDEKLLTRNLGLAIGAANQEGDEREADQLADRHQVLLERLLPIERDPLWRVDLLESQVLLLSYRVQSAIELGLMDQAALVLEREERLGAELKELDPTSSTWIQPILDRCTLDHARQRFEAVIETVTDAEKDVTNHDYLSQLALLRASSWRELAREGKADPDRAEQLLRSILDSPTHIAGVRAQAECVLAGLLVAGGQLDEADHLLSRTIEGGAPEAQGLPGKPSEKLGPFLALRARIALARKASRETLAGLLEELERLQGDKLASARRGASRPGGIGFFHWGSQREVISTLIRLELATGSGDQAVEAAFQHVLRAQQIGSFARSHDIPACDLQTLRERLLLGGQGAVVFLPSLDESDLFLIDRDRIRNFPLPSRDVLMRAVTSFDSTLRSSRSDGAVTERLHRAEREQAGVALRDLLFPPEAIAIIESWEGFYASGTELCGFPPLQLLPWTHGRSLGEEKALAELPSIHIGAWLAERARLRHERPGMERLVSLAAPRISDTVKREHPELAPFELSAASETALRKPFASARVLTGPDATSDRLVAELASPASMLELFVHGVLDPARPRPAGLVLAPRDDREDGVLGSEEIESRIDSPPLVALFACGAALGQTRLGDDTTAMLALSFFDRGADVVLLSRSSLEYQAMLALSQAFKRALATPGISRAEALRRARIELVASSADHDPLPYGRLSLLGLGLIPSRSNPVSNMRTEVGETIDSPTSVRWWIVASAFVAAACAAAWMLRRRS